ncbi:MAG: SsrA-binding protein SmpB [Anaerolineae bacterium]|nr:SsrA-binding protein SmpB [Anaerolineae bacterium]
MATEHVKIIATNRKARHQYFIEESLEAGIVLTGTEIKSIRAGHISIQEAYVAERQGELWVLNMHIAQYDPAHRDNHDPLRPRKLLMHRREIDKWSADVQRKGYTIVVLRVYLSRGRAKIEIGLAKGQKQHDKRQAIAKRESERKIRRTLREQSKGY